MSDARAASLPPFATRGRRTIVAILLTFALFSALSVALSIRATARSKHQAAVVEVAARQRTLAERYVKEVLLVQRAATQADPAYTGAAARAERATCCSTAASRRRSNGDDDETTLAGADRRRRSAPSSSRQRRLVARPDRDRQRVCSRDRPVDARAADRATSTSPPRDPVQRLRVLAALTSNVSLNAARTIADRRRPATSAT